MEWPTKVAASEAAAVSLPIGPQYREERPGAASGAMGPVVLAAGADWGENPWRRIHNPLKETFHGVCRGFRESPPGGPSSQHHGPVPELQGADRQRQGRRPGDAGQGQGHRDGRERAQLLRHPRGAAGGAAGQRRPHHRDRQVRRRAEGLLRGELLEHGAHRRRPVQRDGHHDPRRDPRRPLRHEERQGPRAGHGRDPHDVRGGHHVHRHRRVPPAQRPEPACEPRRQFAYPGMGRPGDRDRRDQGLHGAVHAG